MNPEGTRSTTMDDEIWQNQYGGYAPGEAIDRQTCMHRFVTGADGSQYCERCGALLKGGPDPYGRGQPRATQSSGRLPVTVLIVALAVIAVVVVSVIGWRYVTRTPAPVESAEQAQPIDLATEPVQVSSANAELHQQPDGTAIVALASYKIYAKVIGVRTWAPYDHASSGFPIDLALTWGDVAASDYHKYVDFHFTTDYSANQWLMYQFRWGVSPPWSQAYFMCHVSNNHVCPASRNLYNAVKSLKEGDQVIIEGYLALSKRADGSPVLNSSLTRDDTDAGACEAFFVNRLQIGNRVYK
jgi:hypothetical protein